MLYALCSMLYALRPMLYASAISHPTSQINLGMISQFQLYGMRVQVDLLFQVGLVVLAHIVADQS
jgi:hypothetical protein